MPHAAEDPPLLYETLATELAALIDRGALRPGDRLPSVRRLRLQRRVSVSTVLQAYLLLESRGRVETRPPSGHYVLGTRGASLPEPRIARAPRGSSRVTVSDRVAKLYGAVNDPRVVPLG